MRSLSAGRKKDNFEIRVKEVYGYERHLGLMFKGSSTNNLLFYFSEHEKPAIHSFFVFFPFLALWLNENDEILEWNVVKPFTFYVSPKFRAARLIELPFNKNNKKIIRDITKQEA